MTVDTRAKAQLREGLVKSGLADFSAPGDPANLTVIRYLTAICDDAWTDRTIDADVLRGLLVEGAAEARERFEVVGARVVGVLDLQGVALPRIFSLRRCLLDRVELGHAVAGRLDLSGCHVRDSVTARDLRAAGQVSLRGMTVEDGINLESARIDGTADLRDARLCSRQPDALILTGARIGGSVRLDGAQIEGVIAAMGVRIDNGLVLNGATVEGRRRPISEPQTSVTPRFGNPAPTTWALLADHAIIGGAVSLSLRSHALEQRATWSANCVRLNGGISFFAATIGGNVVADYAYLRAERGYALTLETATIGGALLLRGATVEGGVRLFSAKVNVAVECDDGAFMGGPLTVALDAQLCTVGGPVHLRNGFQAEGGVDALRASVGGTLDCRGGQFYGRRPAKLSKDDLGNPALNLRDATVEGTVFLTHPFTAKGAVVLCGSDVAASVNAIGGWFENPGGVALDAAGMHVKRELALTGATLVGDLDLSHAQVTSFFDDRHSWPHSNVTAGGTTAHDGTSHAHLDLDGFRYESLRSPDLSWKDRREWLRLQRLATQPQPFLQLAAAYRTGGMDREARKILIARHNEGLRGRNLWRQLLRITVGHGYEPLRALLLAFAIFTSGCVVFDYGARQELLVPSRATTAVSSNCEAKTYPCLSPYVYSLDTLLPVINLRQRDYWVPDPERGQWVAVFAWTSTVLGWVLGLLVIAGFSGLVRRD